MSSLPCISLSRKPQPRTYKLYELWGLVDAIRDSRAREREIAVNEIEARLQ